MLTPEQRKIWEEMATDKPHIVLKKYRTEFGLAQKDVGERMGLKCNSGCSTVAEFEGGGKKYVSFNFVLRYVTALYPKETNNNRKNGYMKRRISEINGKNRC